MTRDEMAWTLFHQAMARVEIGVVALDSIESKLVADNCYCVVDDFLMCNLRTKESASVSGGPVTADESEGSPSPAPADGAPVADNSRGDLLEHEIAAMADRWHEAHILTAAYHDNSTTEDMRWAFIAGANFIHERQQIAAAMGNPHIAGANEYPVPVFGARLRDPTSDDIRQIWNWWNDLAELDTMRDFRIFLLNKGLCR